MSAGYSKTTELLINIPNISSKLPLILDSFSLASTLGLRNKTLWYLMLNTRKHYKRILIPKKSGGKRVIHDPSSLMKYCQTQVLKHILSPLQEDLGVHVAAYRKGLSVRNAVEQHIPKCSVCDSAPLGMTPSKHPCPRTDTHIQIDLKDFFPSTRSAWIRNYFKSLGYSHDVSGYLGSLLTVRDIKNKKYCAYNEDTPEFFSGVPQGSPASGAICNLVADQRLDKKIITLLKGYNLEYKLEGPFAWKYTRYSDDLAFTCGKQISREDTDKVISDIYSVIARSGYRANKKKTRVARNYRRKHLLGIVFNSKPNIQKNELKSLRSLVRNCYVHGFESQYVRAGKTSSGELRCWLAGKLNWVNQVNTKVGERLLTKYDAAVALHVEDYHGSENVG